MSPKHPKPAGTPAELRERIIALRQRRAQLEARFGIVPLSVLEFPKQPKLRAQVMFYQNEHPETRSSQQPAAVRKQREWEAAGFSGMQASGIACGSGTLGLSVMPPEMVDFFVRYYAAPGQTYLDPFAGQAVRMQVANMRGLNYIGTDVCKRFLTFGWAVAERFPKDGPSATLHECDARFPEPVPDGVGDFCFTSPPYWNIEHYGDEPEQLGEGRTYEDFLLEMEGVARAWLPKFKPGAWCIINVNDFRRSGRFYTYHADIAHAFARAGWLPWDCWVIKGLSTLRRVFAVSSADLHYAPKVHEYGLVFRAPECAHAPGPTSPVAGAPEPQPEPAG